MAGIGNPRGWSPDPARSQSSRSRSFLFLWPASLPYARLPASALFGAAYRIAFHIFNCFSLPNRQLLGPRIADALLALYMKLEKRERGFRAASHRFSTLLRLRTNLALTVHVAEVQPCRWSSRRQSRSLRSLADAGATLPAAARAEAAAASVAPPSRHSSHAALPSTAPYCSCTAELSPAATPVTPRRSRRSCRAALPPLLQHATQPPLGPRYPTADNAALPHRSSCSTLPSLRSRSLVVPQHGRRRRRGRNSSILEARCQVAYF